MYAYLEGAITYKSPSLLYLDIGGVGYEVNITLQTFSKIQNLDTCKLYTHIQVREDAWILYGFASEEERSTFRQLLSINGVGASTARIILSSLTPAELEKAIAYEDTAALQKIKGIGAKTAQRIILELKGKLLPDKGTETVNNLVQQHNTPANDALIALINLGISKVAAEAALKKINDASSLTIENLVKQALQNL